MAISILSSQAVAAEHFNSDAGNGGLTGASPLKWPSTQSDYTYTATSLGIEAAKLALEQAGIRAEQLGLVLGDNATPHQTTPSEAQRVAGALGLKVNAFDMTAGTPSLAVMLEYLNNCQSSRLPEYILLVSSNTPTQRVEGVGIADQLVGDVAGAAVISTKSGSRGTLELVNVNFERVNVPVGEFDDLRFTLDTHGYLHFSEQIPAVVKWGVRQQTRLALKRCATSLDRVRFLGSCFSDKDNGAVASDCGISERGVWSNVDRLGFSFGALPFAALKGRWEQMQLGDLIIVALADPAVCILGSNQKDLKNSDLISAHLNCGYATFRVKED